MAGTVLAPPPIRRGEGSRSGAPSGMMAQTQPAQGPDRERASTARPDLAREQDVRSGLWPKPWMAKAKVPSAAVRPTLHLIRGKPRSGRIVGGGLSFGDFSLTTQRKVTRPSPKGGRNPFEASGLASCAARPCRIPPKNCKADDYAYRLIDPTIARRSRACLPQARSLAGRRDATDKGGRGRPYRPKNDSQSLNTGCNPACRTAAATSPTGLSSWMANCSSSSASPSA